MNVVFPSGEFDDAAGAVCNGSASDEQLRALNGLLRSNPTARDEYILRVELHSRLASEPDLFPKVESDETPAFHGWRGRMAPESVLATRSSRRVWDRKVAWIVALAACVVVVAMGLWIFQISRPTERMGATSKAIAMLNRAVDTQWGDGVEAPRLSAPLEPGWLRLNAGLAQIVFYSGARVVVEGPVELELISPNEAGLLSGRLTAEIPPEARGFRIHTPQTEVTDLGTSFGLDVKTGRTELHVLKGSVELRLAAQTGRRNLTEGAGVVVENSRPPQLIAANRAAFASLFDLQARSVTADAQRFDQWQGAGERCNADPALLVRFDFEDPKPSSWQLRNVSRRHGAMTEATIVGCQWVEGRWSKKRALEFQSVSDRVRLNVPGDFESLTLAAWVRVQGLDRKLNSLFMCDGFDSGTVHWLIRHDGVLGLTIVGTRSDNYQIVTSPSVLTLDKFGMWLHLSVVLDGPSRRVAHYVNGLPVSEKELKLGPPYRIGTAELGNWNATGFPENNPFMIRNFSGAMDEFCLFERALDPGEIHALYAGGKPQPDRLARR